MKTKAQEREALNKIQAIIESMGEDSYIGKAFEGCCETAQDNIDNDFLDSWKRRAEHRQEEIDALILEKVELLDTVSRAEREIEAQEREIEALNEELAGARHDIEVKHEIIQQMKEEAKTESEAAETMINQLMAQDDEIIKLKAKLYDMMTQ